MYIMIKKFSLRIKKMEEKELKGKELLKAGYNLRQFRHESIKKQKFLSLPRKQGQAYLRGTTTIRLLKDIKTYCLDKIFVIDRECFSVYEVNKTKTAISYLYSSKMQNSENLVLWSANPYIFVDKFDGRLMFSLTPEDTKNIINHHKGVKEGSPILSLFKTNLKDAREGELLSVNLVSRIIKSNKFYQIKSAMSFYPLYLNNIFINSSTYYLTKYSYEGENRPGRLDSSTMIDVVRNKPDSRGLRTKSVFEFLGWDFASSKILQQKLKQEKFLIEDENFRQKVKICGNEIGVHSLNSNKSSRYFIFEMDRPRFLVLSLLDLRLRKVLKTTYVTVYELWAGLDPSVARGWVLDLVDFYYLVSSDELHMIVLVESIDPEDQSEEEEGEGFDFEEDDSFEEKEDKINLEETHGLGNVEGVVKSRRLSVKISNVFNKDTRRIESKISSDEQGMEDYDHSTLSEINQTSSEVEFIFRDKFGGSKTVLALNKKENEIDYEASELKMIVKVDESKFVFFDSRNMYLIDKEEKIVLQKIKFCHSFDDKLEDLYSFSDLIVNFDSSKFSFDFYRIEQNQVELIQQAGLSQFRFSQFFQKYTQIEFLGVKRIDFSTIFLSFASFNDYAPSEKFPQNSAFFLEVSLSTKEVKFLNQINLDRAYDFPDLIKVHFDDENGIAYLINYSVLSVEISPLDSNFRWLFDKKMSYSRRDYQIDEYFYKDFYLFVTFFGTNELSLVKFDPEFPQRDPIVSRRIVCSDHLRLLEMKYDRVFDGLIWTFEIDQNVVAGVAKEKVRRLTAYDFELKKVTQLELGQKFFNHVSLEEQVWRVIDGNPALIIPKKFLMFDSINKVVGKVEKPNLIYSHSNPKGQLIFTDFDN